MNIIAIIPARAGSKRLPGKNTKTLGDKPLLAHTIQAALDASCFEHLIVSTEDAEIAEVAKYYGAEVPWLRSTQFATDDSPVIDSVTEVLQKLIVNKKSNVDAVMLLQPTSPFRSTVSILRAVELFERVQPESVVSVSPASTHPFWCKMIDAQGVIKPFCSEQEMPARFQDLPPVYQLNGLIYLSNVRNLYQQKSFYSPNTQALIIDDPKESVDIDTTFDWLVAETIMQSKYKE